MKLNFRKLILAAGSKSGLGQANAGAQVGLYYHSKGD